MTRDPSGNSRRVLDLINPRSVAVIGASEDTTKFGGRLYKSLLRHGYDGEVFPINPKREQLLGRRTYPGIEAVPHAPDMVVMALPRDQVLPAIEACAARGTKAGIIITSKFSDAGAEGARIESEVVAAAARHGMRLIGPNCLGLISPNHKLALCSSPALNVDSLIRSPIGFISQSGALMGTLFDRSHEMGIGFSHCVSVGNQADLELCDFVEALIDDDGTSVICSYVEGIKSPARFVALARRAREAGKPWLLVKAGATAVGASAAFSHTASLAGDYAALRAVCERENIAMLEDPMDMLVLAHAMVTGKKVSGGGTMPPRGASSLLPPKVARTAVFTTSGGGGAIAADQLTAAGLPLATLTPATHARLDEHYTPGQVGNPLDMGGRRNSGSPDIGYVSASAVLADDEVDLMLVVMTTAPDVTGTTRQIIRATMEQDKPVLYVMLPGPVAAGARAALVEHRLPYVNSLAEAIGVLRAWRRWSAYQAPDAPRRPARSGLSASQARAAEDAGSGHDAGPPLARPFALPGKGVLDELQVRALLAAAGLPVNRLLVARDPAQARQAAAALGWPVVLKILSREVTHKSDVGGVALNLGDDAALEAAMAAMAARIKALKLDDAIDGYTVQSQESGELELIIGARRDPQFGPLVVIGAGGVLVELLNDVVTLPAPVGPDSARRALLGLKVAPLLGAWRGRGALDLDAVVDSVVALSWLAHDLFEAGGGEDFEIEVNPLLVRRQGEGASAVDARARIGQDGAFPPGPGLA